MGDAKLVWTLGKRERCAALLALSLTYPACSERDHPSPVDPVGAARATDATDDSARTLDAGPVDGVEMSDQATTRGEDAATAPSADTDARQDAAVPGADPIDDAAAPPDLDPSAAPAIPVVDLTCPAMASGAVRMLGMDVRLWVGPPRDEDQGMLLLYWHGVGGLADEATAMLGPNLQRILDSGGMVASFSETLGTGTDNALGTWYEDDFAVADAIVACAIEQHGIDPRRIHVAGCGLGAFQAGAMLYARSSYLASGVLVQGGVMAVRELETADHVPALITSYDTDDGPISFVPRGASEILSQDLADHGGLIVRCPNHRCGGAELVEAHWRFLQDNPYGASADIYDSGLPDIYPPACRLGPH